MLRRRSPSDVCEAILNVAVESINADNNLRIALHQSIGWLLSLCMEKADSLVNFTTRRAALDEWVVMISALLALEILGTKNYSYLRLEVGILWKGVFVSTISGIKTLKSGKVEAQGFLYWFLGLRRYVYLSVLCRTDICTNKWMRRRSILSCPVRENWQFWSNLFL